MTEDKIQKYINDGLASINNKIIVDYARQSGDDYDLINAIKLTKAIESGNVASALQLLPWVYNPRIMVSFDMLAEIVMEIQDRNVDFVHQLASNYEMQLKSSGPRR